MNPNASGNKDVVELWGREFNIVKSGLSEAQVVSFVNDLAKQHDVLIQRQEHLAALTKLAERTVSEADKLAAEMKAEAKAEVDAETARIVAETEAKARAEAERVVGEAQAQSDARIRERETKSRESLAEHAASVKADAERVASDIKAEAEKVASEKKAEAEKVASEKKAEAEKLCNDIMAEAEEKASRTVSDAESRGRHIIEQKEAEAVKTANEQATAILKRAEREASTMLEREKKRIQPELNEFVDRLRGQLLSNLDSLKFQVGALEPGLPQQPTRPSYAPEPAPRRAAPKVEERDEFLDLVGNTGGDDSGEPEWDLEVIPPIDIMKIMNIVSYIDGLPEVSRTEIIPRNDKTSITVYLNRPVDMLALIEDLPEVARANEAESSGENGKLKRITVSLSVKSEVAESL